MDATYRPTLKTWFSPNEEERRLNRRFLFSFSGRVERSCYWQFAVAPFLSFVVLASSLDLPVRMGSAGFTIVGLAFCWITLAVAAKRCHDRNRSGWFLLVGLIPLVGPLWLLFELGIKQGAQGPNRFGDDPVPHAGNPTAL